jgi:biotin operon repressor
MAIPKNISRNHIVRAMERIKENGIPIAFRSTKFDVLR